MLLLRETVLQLFVLLRQETVKYEKLHNLPVKPRVFIAVLYLVALGLVMAAYIIALMRDYTLGFTLAVVLELVLLAHLLKRA